MARRSRSNIGCRRFRKPSSSVSSSTLPSCDGGSNATIRNSSRRSGWDILKDGDGAASTITPLFSIAAYGFLISERETIPPSTDRATRVFPQFALREGYQPRGSAVAARTPRSELDCNNAKEIGGRSRHDAIALPMLRGLGTDTEICDTV